MDFSVDDIFLTPSAGNIGLGGTGPYVVNLQASSTPINVPSQDAGGQHACYYSIQRVEDGRMRYRLRLGPFTREDEADAALARVRNDYPGALTATACAEDLSSIAKMRAKGLLIQPVGQASPGPGAQTAYAAAAPLAAPDAAVAQSAAEQSSPERSLSAQPHREALPKQGPPEQVRSERAGPERVFPEQALAEQALPKQALPRQAPPKQPLAEQPQHLESLPKPALSKESLSKSTQELELVQDVQELSDRAVPPPSRHDPSSIDVNFDISSISLSLELPQEKQLPQEKPADALAELVAELQSTTPAQPRPKSSAKPVYKAPTSLDSTQTLRPLSQSELQDLASRWFVIELSVAGTPFDPATVPNLDIFVLYTLYSIEGIDQGQVTHALRLGFFGEEMAAQAVANYLTTYYENSTVKRVSVAERERFAEQRIDARKDVGETGQHSVIEITSELPALTPRTTWVPPAAAGPRPIAPTSTKKDKPAGLFGSLPWVKRRS
ncbi:MAG: SPOR domain-containing protein [Pseudomonadota bacterium]|nr:SPOR domain-containing protein [Pseudomonadota bacterium]